MKYIKNTIAVVLVTIFIASCANMPLYQSKNINNKKELSDLRYYDKNSKTFYDVYNDKNNIYVCINALDYFSQEKILKQGLTIWLDQKTKKNKDKGIVFPQKLEFKKNKESRNLNNLNPFNREEQKIEQLHNQYLLSLKNTTLIGMDGENSIRVFNSELEKSNIKATITFDTLNRLNYLAIIPKNKIFTDDKYNNNTFSIGIESGFMDMNSNKLHQKKPGMENGGGMRSGNRQPGGRSVGHSEQRSALSEPIKIWFSVNLINNQVH